jgi:hypothetical protein
MCPEGRKKEGSSHILRCEGIRIWTDELLDKKITGIDPELELESK